jgi:hypothetical protein
MGGCRGSGGYSNCRGPIDSTGYRIWAFPKRKGRMFSRGSSPPSRLTKGRARGIPHAYAASAVFHVD